MYLTKEEERILDGESGWANETCMKILVKLGELYGAKKLIPIASAHVSGVSYKTLGDAPIEFLHAMADNEGKIKVASTLNPQSFDPEYLSNRLPRNIRSKQLSILEQFDRMGFTRSLTCTPYYLSKPRQDSTLAWSESSAVVYANSVLGAWTNREGGPSALAAAIIGKTPQCGIHLEENRRPNIRVIVDAVLHNEAEYGALGAHLGRILRDRIPLIKGLRNSSQDQLKQLGAALAATGMTNMFYQEEARKEEDIEETITVEAVGTRRALEDLSTCATRKPDLVFVGCPHCSRNEIRKIALSLESKRVRDGTELWVCTSRCVKEKTKSDVDAIERTGAHVLVDMCTIVSWTEMLGIRSIMTNAAKTAYYAPTLNKAEVVLAPLKECLKSAVKG
jgi:predicted aconitase